MLGKDGGMSKTTIEHEETMPREIVVDHELSLRFLSANDTERIFEILEADNDIRDHVGLFADCDSLERLREKIADQMAHGALRYAITLEGVLVGYVGIHIDPDEDQFNQYIISDFLSSEYRGRGIMGKSLEALLTEAEKSLKVDRFSAWVEEGNPASANVLKRLGFEHTNIPYKDSKGRINWDYIREVKRG